MSGVLPFGDFLGDDEMLSNIFECSIMGTVDEFGTASNQLDLRFTTLQTGWQVYQDSQFGLLCDYVHWPTMYRAARDSIVPGPEWTALAIPVGSGGKIILKPVSHEARRLVRAHVFRTWQCDYGLTPGQTTRLYSSTAPYKFEMIKVISAIIRNPEYHKAVKAFPLDDVLGKSVPVLRIESYAHWLKNCSGEITCLLGLTNEKIIGVMRAVRDALGE